MAGQELTYTLAFENTGPGAAEIDYIDHMTDVLDDVTLIGDIETSNGASVAGPTENQLPLSGTVEAGDTATVTYTGFSSMTTKTAVTTIWATS